jgi:hypothetical protein
MIKKATWVAFRRLKLLVDVAEAARRYDDSKSVHKWFLISEDWDSWSRKAAQSATASWRTKGVVSGSACP